MCAPVSAEPLWQLSRVQVRHGRGTWPAQPIDLAIPAGRVAVLGLSGAGKTRLLNLLAGFAPAASGTIRGPRQVGWVPQNHGLWLGHTVREHLTLAGANADAADTLLSHFDL